MGAVTALNALSIFEYSQIGNSNPVLNQGVNLNQECESCHYSECVEAHRCEADFRLYRIIISIFDRCKARPTYQAGTGFPKWGHPPLHCNSDEQLPV